MIVPKDMENFTLLIPPLTLIYFLILLLQKIRKWENRDKDRDGGR